MDDSPERMVAIRCEIAAKLNFACHQSAYPVLRDFQIENLDEEDRIDNLQVTISADPPFLKSKTWHVDRIPAGGIAAVQYRDLELDGGFLLNLSDSMRGSVLMRVEKDGALLAEEVRPAELLAYNEWGGAGFMPELLAAFCVPNDPAVDRILHAASKVLEQAGRPAGIDGYKSGSRQRVWEIASAIYAAIANIGISYALPPASFERDGQKIRLPGHICDTRVATCLDTTMLFASAFEQAGLNPIVALPKAHAVVGVWLQPEELSTIVVEDAETLRKRHDLKELVLIETTFATSHPALPFSRAVTAGMNTVAVDRDDTFVGAVDIRRARAHRISPLGLKITSPSDGGSDAARGQVSVALEEAPALPRFDEGIAEEAPETPAGRLDRWQRKLLDLSARNPLLNHKSTKASLKIFCPDPGLLEDKLAEGARISIQSPPQPTAQAQDRDLHLQRTGESIDEEYARRALDKGQVLVDLPPDELSKRAVDIYRKAQTALQEGGSNTLYLALGFLLWKRDENDERRFRAPLILLPVTLQRQSVRSGVRMLAHDDEPRFNTTLLEMLRKDFRIDIKGLDGSLPEDHSGVDVSGVWDMVRRAIRDVPGFEVVEDVVLGHFSFAKFLMWKDLMERTDALRDNPVVRHLIDTPRDAYPSDVPFVGTAQLDRDFKPSDLFVPLPADASQMAAIATADRGKDFIVIGPPGTGKSQTIGNLVAHMLGKGKTVLFVSEKTAALNVVYRRLEEIGLARFCLELHSNKARKADVLKQLGSAWSSHGHRTAKDWETEAERLRVLRDRLNRVVTHLHCTHRNGLTAHYAIGLKVRDEAMSTRLKFTWPGSDQHDAEDLARMREAAELLKVQAAAVVGLSNGPFDLVATGEWTPLWEGELVEHAGRLSEAADTADRAVAAFCDVLGISPPDHSLKRLDALADLARVLVESHRQQTSYALEADGSERIEALDEAVSRLTAYADARSRLSCVYDPMAWRQLDGDLIARRWSATANAWWLKRVFARRALIRSMRIGGAHGKPDPAHDAALLACLRKEGEAIDRLDKKLSIFGRWAAHDTDPDDAAQLRDLGERVRVAIGWLADDAPSLAAVRGQVRSLLHEGNDLLAPEAAVGRAAANWLRARERLAEESASFEGLAGRVVRDAFADGDDVLTALREAADALVERRAELRNWCAWRKRRTEAIDLGLGPLVEGIEQGRVPVEEIPETFEAAYCAWWSAAVIGEDEVLRTFSTPEHTNDIDKFRRFDTEFQSATAEYVAASLAGALPNQDEVNRSSQWGILRHELSKKRRHKPVRQLLQEVPEVVTTLAPCLMMSPLSVAQYLPADQSLFDVVIFDEASQITVWDAVGSIARGRQVIVAGDPKQMPPTNFFSRSDDDPDGDVDYEGDLESILDELRSSSIPECTLNLHYRSRRESLIAFSNSRYYDNGLVTFPAPVHPDRGVRLVRPDGFYARGKARHNEGEARAIVDEIVRRLISDDPVLRKQTIGVVTFNSEQQSLIEDLLDRARSSNPEIEWAFGEDQLEPVFVKNLETVQGDERDVILFSITYGPDQSGHVTMNFGPLNRSGGERRLNVAMTRARTEMVVFSTLHPDRIDLSRTNAAAVKDLKHFLEYAERGSGALGAGVHGSLGDFESPFEVAVARSLREKGWIVHPQIGVSAFRIDLGIVHPDEPGVYLAGVECDGAMYHSSAFARERDKIRQSVLERLGWTLFRVWSTDWWVNRPDALAKLDQQLHARLHADREDRKAASRHDDVAVEGLPDRDPGTEEVVCPEHASTTEQQETTKASVPRVVPLPDTKSRNVGDGNVNAVAANQTSLLLENEDDRSGANRYHVASFREGILEANPERFYEQGYEAHLTAMADHVIDTEGPIHEDILVRRIARHHGFQRAGRQIRELVLRCARGRRGHTKEEVGVFFWSKGTVKDRHAPARYIGRDEELRKVEYICLEELRAIADATGTGKDSVELARALGIARLSATARKRLEAAFDS